MRGSSPAARWLAVAAWAAVIFVASTGWFAESRTAAALGPLFAWLVPDGDPDRVQAVHTGLRKLGHFVEYAILGWLIASALRAEQGWRPRQAVVAVALAAAYAVTDELHQRVVFGRTAAVGDVLIDTLGALSAQLWFPLRERWARRRDA